LVARCSQDEAIYQFPMIKTDGLKGAIVYYDAQQNDARMNVLLVLTGKGFVT
jgi:glycerol-3-phosphate dehydrogenase